MRSTIRYIFVSLVLLLGAVTPVFADSISGHLVEQVVDYPDRSSQTIYYLVSKTGQSYRLDLATISSLDPINLKSGAELTLSGVVAAGVEPTFHVEKVLNFQAAPSIAADGVVGGQVVSGSRRMAIILLSLQNAGLGYSVPITCSSATVTNKVYDDSRSMTKIYELSSRNQLTFTRDTDTNGTADVFGPYTITGTPGSCDYSTWGNLGDLAATTAGVDLSAYQHKVYVLPDYSDIGCSEVGRGDVSCGNSCRSWIFICDDVSIFAHEVGHNLGMHHAGTDLDNNGVIDDEYGDMSCPMGYATGRSYNFNAPHDDQMGWFDSNPSKSVVVSTPGTYHLGPLDRDSGSTPYPQMLKIQAASHDFIYVSYRRSELPIDQLDSAYSNRVSIHRYKNSTGEKSRLLSLLNDGQSFADSTIGVVVSMDSHNSNEATVSVSFPSQGTDSDGDGVTDYREGQDGSSSADPGSHLNHLSSPVYLLWNSFLGMTNIAELINPSSDTSAVTTINISLYSIAGQLMHSQTLNLNGGQQFDLILNQLPGFVADSYGIVKIEYSGSLEGRTSYYRPSGSEYEFAYSIPLTQPLLGNSGVGFNTFQPSTNPSETAYSVYNWLSLINLSPSDETFTVNTYNQVGVLITSRQITVPQFGRADVDGGHTLAGAGVVGLHEIVPQHSNTPYIAQLIRYGSNAAPGTAPSGYFFAFPLSAHPGNGQPIMLPTSRQFSESNWVEVANLKNAPVNVSVTFYDFNGSIQSSSLSLAAHAQSHFFVDDSRLADSSRGYVKIDSDTPNSVIAQSMFYYRNTAGSLKAMYGIESREPLGAVYNGSYNLFLGMENWLSISNTASQYITATVETVGSSGSSNNDYSIAPDSTIVLPIHSTTYNAASNTYGFIRVTSDRQGAVIADLIRTRRLTSDFDFAFPTAVRPE